MNYFDWFAQEQTLTDAALTVRVQQIPPNDTGKLFFDLFFPREDVDSVVLNQISGRADFRPVGERREWNTRGRQSNIQTPNLSSLEMLPIETYFKVEEREIQKLTERTQDNQTLFRSIISASIPERTDQLANMNFRRMEMDALQAWAKGTITVMNPTGLGSPVTVSYGMDSARFQTAGTAWNAVADAYTTFLAWVEDGLDAVGSARGVMLHRSTFNEIQADAPVGLNGIKLTRQQMADRISQDLGIDFQFVINEQRLDKYTDGGLTTTRTNTWPLHYVALIPVGTAVGTMAHAPIARAYTVARLAPDAQTDVRGMSVFKEIGGNGRELTVECQINAFPLPIEQNMWTINAGV